MDLKGTLSEKNVKAAFLGESQARNKYTYFALQAATEGHDDIAKLFEKMANNEREHAKIWFKMLHNGLGNTLDNLKQAALGENDEWKNMYPSFADQARADGLEMLALMFEKIAAIENDHEKHFLEALLTLLQNKSAAGDAAAAAAVKEMPPVPPVPKAYRCMFCGATSDTRMDVCSVCEAIGSFELNHKN